MTDHKCRLGYEEHDGARYCFEHGGFAHYLMHRTSICDNHPNFALRIETP